MNKANDQGTRDRLSAVVLNSLDTQARTPDLARQAYQSRTQFHRLFRTVVEETPAAMRRRLLLERAAYQLGHTGMSVTEVALDANYNSLEARRLCAASVPGSPPAMDNCRLTVGRHEKDLFLITFFITVCRLCAQFIQENTTSAINGRLRHLIPTPASSGWTPLGRGSGGRSG
jgi:AraC-like DNA-binding protein